jgi:iron complex transport system ATP-binding protein
MSRLHTLKLLRRLASETDKGILLATHELDLALQTADLIWLTGSEHNIIQGIPEDLVLNGAFDRIFQFKGFDLKTGKVQHEPYRKTRVTVEGEGFVFLWTKSALQRTGFETTANGGQLIEIKSNGDAYSWHSQGKAFLTLEDLILHLAASG